MQGIHSEEAVKISLLLANPNATHLSPPPLVLHQCFLCRFIDWAVRGLNIRLTIWYLCLCLSNNSQLPANALIDCHGFLRGRFLFLG